MGVDLTAAWCEIEGLVDSLAPLLHEIVLGKDETYSQYSSVVRERLQKIMQLCNWARQASSEVQRRATATQQLQQRLASSALAQSSSVVPSSGPLQGRVRGVNQYEIAGSPAGPSVQQAQLHAYVQQMGMPTTIQAAQAVYPQGTLQGQLLMGMAPAAMPFASGSAGPGPPLKRQAVEVRTQPQALQATSVERRKELGQS
eukprot:evm.model.scf_2218.1 EVM.evm.TU.scf_2218.1   scf_2218:1662-3147(+)